VCSTVLRNGWTVLHPRGGLRVWRADRDGTARFARLSRSRGFAPSGQAPPPPLRLGRPSTPSPPLRHMLSECSATLRKRLYEPCEARFQASAAKQSQSSRKTAGRQRQRAWKPLSAGASRACQGRSGRSPCAKGASLTGSHPARPFIHALCWNPRDPRGVALRLVLSRELNDADLDGFGPWRRQPGRAMR
jgi:hypothetical protein